MSTGEDPSPPGALGDKTSIALTPVGVRPKVVWPAATTTVVGVVGFPARHSLSPQLHNAAYATMGLDWCYLAFEVPAGSLERAVAGAAAFGFRGLSVTMPHKDAAARLATRHSRQVRRLGAANTLIFEASAIRAESVDGDGLLDDLREGAHFDPAGRRCGVIGAGGAGRAAVLALAEAGAAEIVVVNRTATRAWRSVALAPKVAHVGRPDELRGMDLVIQATPSGMPSRAGGARTAPRQLAQDIEPVGQFPPRRSGHSEATQMGGRSTGLKGSPSSLTGGGSTEGELEGSSLRGHPAHLVGSLDQYTTGDLTDPKGHHEARPKAGAKGEENPRGSSLGGGEESALVSGVDPAWFGSGQLVVDLVYDPPLTPFLLGAERQGATVRSGLGMLVHQAARQIRLWTGMEPPIEAMWAAVLGHGLEGRGPGDGRGGEAR